MINIDYKSDLPIYEQIIEQFKINIMKGVFSAGDSVPSVRKMAATLGITPSTVAKAYAELERQGVIETVRAKGTFIAANAPESVPLNIEKNKSKMLSEIIELKHAGYSLSQIQSIVKELYESI
ncbi:MAG: GntR family transcriptional regulator [Lachnospiraceae bacterium]|nr:GntR family transcriptional regulator [Lachnospiraceae bacterium]